MNDFVLGQRWVSQTEPELGLGVIVGLEGRNVTVRFPAAEEDRVYARASSPLARVIYQVGDQVVDSNAERSDVKAVDDVDGLKIYLVADATGGQRLLPETQVSGYVKLSTPSQRLLSGQFDKDHAYELRVASLMHSARLQQQSVRGLLGARTSLLEHQVYIAAEVAHRYAPRVLLADEVGLGKTVEAGLILHHQLQTGMASRALIVVPDALLHQWLVEMLRKFNLRFALFDRERVAAFFEDDSADELDNGEVTVAPDEVATKGATENPFESEQLILCGLSLVTEDQRALEWACSAQWDLLVVDEAHHLSWHSEWASPEYKAIEALSRHCAGLLLLTATPEQLGRDSHFARLRLLDPDRFADLDAFKQEQSQYIALNNIFSTLTAGQALQPNHLSLLKTLGETPPAAGEDSAAFVARLLDRHGTGRVLFRNTRQAVTGFPSRVYCPHRLECDPQRVANAFAVGAFPERYYREQQQRWVRFDPRVEWLEMFLKDRANTKVLVICADAGTALDLEQHLHLNVGIRVAAFHEDLTIIERDRAAAYFAETEAGAQALICSEIGSEGRNFQFAHHLVMFDLPDNPDLLEQRIGRLDRIGQTRDVNIHVPYIAGSPGEVMACWYHEGINAFESSYSAGALTREAVAEAFEATLSAEVFEAELVDALIERTQRHVAQVRDELMRGRDRLLELNSCNAEIASQLIESIVGIEATSELSDYLLQVFDVFGIEYEPQSDATVIIRPSTEMLIESFPGLGDSDLTITFSREKALVREDIEFISWEAPMLSGVLEFLLGSELGNTTISTIALKGVPAGTLLLECFFGINVNAPKTLQLWRFLPSTPVRVLLDVQERELTKVITHEQLNGLCQPVRKAARPAIIKEVRSEFEHMLQAAERIAQPELAPLKNTARQRVEAVLGNEVTRLVALKALNPSVRDEEIEFFRTQVRDVSGHIDRAEMTLEAVRAIITV